MGEQKSYTSTVNNFHKLNTENTKWVVLECSHTLTRMAFCLCDPDCLCFVKIIFCCGLHHMACNSHWTTAQRNVTGKKFGYKSNNVKDNDAVLKSVYTGHMRWQAREYSEHNTMWYKKTVSLPRTDPPSQPQSNDWCLNPNYMARLLCLQRFDF